MLSVVESERWTAVGFWCKRLVQVEREAALLSVVDSGLQTAVSFECKRLVQLEREASLLSVTYSRRKAAVLGAPASPLVLKTRR